LTPLARIAGVIAGTTSPLPHDQLLAQALSFAFNLVVWSCGWSGSAFDGWIAGRGAASGASGTAWGSAVGFRRAGRSPHHRQDSTKSAADPFGGQLVGCQRLLPGQAKIGDDRAGEAQLGIASRHGPGEPVGLLGRAGPGQSPVQGLLPKADGVLAVEAADLGPPHKRQLRGGIWWAGPVGVGNSVTSCDLRILMDQPTKAISS
jgi:hypothetical protein